jgi:hypothetical protein
MDAAAIAVSLSLTAKPDIGGSSTKIAHDAPM